MFPSLKSTKINGFASTVHFVSSTICFRRSKVCMRFDVLPERSSFQHLRQVCGFLPSKNSCLSFCMYSLLCTSFRSVVSKLYLFPSLSFISSSAKQQGRTVPIGDVSRLTHGRTQNLSCGNFTLMLLVLVLHLVCFHCVYHQVDCF